VSGLYTAAIASGSNGNCYYVGNEEDAVLVDAGISCRETEKRMRLLSLPMNKVKGIFITHEHTDHIKGLELIAAKYRIPVYITARTLQNSRLQIDAALIRSFSAFEEVAIGNLALTAFPKQHDAADPHSFVVSGNGFNIGVLTDIGMPCDHVIRYFRMCDAVYLEANYDDQMLESGRYPYHLKKRISGDYGHLSNAQALQLLLDHSTPRLRKVFLAHLSANNNCPELVDRLFRTCTSGLSITVASRYEATKLYQLHAPTATPMRTAVVQASLF